MITITDCHESGDDLVCTAINGVMEAEFRFDTTMMGIPEGSFGTCYYGVFERNMSADADIHQEIDRLQTFAEEHELFFYLCPTFTRIQKNGQAVEINPDSLKDFIGREGYRELAFDGFVSDLYFSWAYEADNLTPLSELYDVAMDFTAIRVSDGSNLTYPVYENFLSKLEGEALIA